MKRFIVYCLLLAIVVFFVGGCNTPGDDIDPGSGEEGIYDWGIPGYKNSTVFGTDDEWPGYELNLADCPNKPDNLGDISDYSNVILTAVLYDREGNKFENTVQPSDLEAQFHILLAGSSGWDDQNKLATQNNLVLEGETTASVSKTGVPGKVLVQAHYQSSKQDTEQVGYIEIQKVVFVPKTFDFALDTVFGTSITFSGNKLIFNNATYSDSASGSNWDGTNGVGSSAILIFPASWGATEKQSLKDKTIKINFTIEAHTCTSASGVTETEHQLNVQAAQNTSEKDLFNGQNPPDHNNVGQKYITLDSTNETGYNTATGTGTISIPANDFIAASNVSGTANDAKGPFILDAVRIVNNGTKWEENASTIHYRCKSYTLVINAVTIE